MTDQAQEVWLELAALVNQRPPEERLRYREAIRSLVHDLGHNIGLVRTSEGLIRREAEANGLVVDEELLDIIHQAVLDLTDLLAVLRAFGDAVDVHSQ